MAIACEEATGRRDEEAVGMTFPAFLDSCRKRMVVQQELQLRSYLVELRDHDLATESGGRVALAPRVDRAFLASILANWPRRAEIVARHQGAV